MSMTVPELALELGYSRRYIHLLAQAGVVPCTRRTDGGTKRKGTYYFEDRPAFRDWKASFIADPEFRKRIASRAHRRGYLSKADRLAKLNALVISINAREKKIQHGLLRLGALFRKIDDAESANVADAALLKELREQASANRL